MDITLPGMISIVAMIGGFSILAGIALFLYHVLARERRIEEQEKKVLLEYQDIIKKAHEQAAELVDKTTDASKKVISQVSGTNEGMNKDLDKILHEMAEKHIQSLNIEASTFKKDYEESILKMQQALNQDLNKTLQSFSQTLLTKTTSSEQVIDEKTKDLMAAADKEAAEYKKQRMEKIDNEITELVKKISHDVLGVSIPADVHKEMILKALEKSKEEGVFDV